VTGTSSKFLTKLHLPLPLYGQVHLILPIPPPHLYPSYAVQICFRTLYLN